MTSFGPLRADPLLGVGPETASPTPTDQEGLRAGVLFLVTAGRDNHWGSLRPACSEVRELAADRPVKGSIR